jgi:DNA-binding GntR family transcriptional regulator
MKGEADNRARDRGRAETPWPRLSPTTLADQVFSVIWDRILSGELEPGEFIREEVVADLMGVSRTPVREALGRLASVGFAERMPRKGYRVPEEPLQALLELYPILAALEVLAARGAIPNLGPDQIQRMLTINEELKLAVKQGDAEEGIALNNLFHHVLSAPCGNGTLCSMLDALRERVHRLELWSFAHVTHRDEAVDQHQELLEAIQRGEIDRALSVLEANRLQTYTAFKEEIRLPGRSLSFPMI